MEVEGLICCFFVFSLVATVEGFFSVFVSKLIKNEGPEAPSKPPKTAQEDRRSNKEEKYDESKRKQ